MRQTVNGGSIKKKLFSENMNKEAEIKITCDSATINNSPPKTIPITVKNDL
jgi:hypothetical protein